MPSYVLAAMALLPALPLLWWALLRRTTTVIPEALTEAVESEDFRRWLAGDSTWFLWGRGEDGRYHAITFGALAARRLIRKANELHKLGERGAAADTDSGSSRT